MLGVAAGGEVSAETHGDGAGGDFGQAGEDDEVGLADGAGESGGEGEGDGEAVGDADDDVADEIRGAKVLLVMGVVVRVVVGVFVVGMRSHESPSVAGAAGDGENFLDNSESGPDITKGRREWNNRNEIGENAASHGVGRPSIWLPP